VGSGSDSFGNYDFGIGGESDESEDFSLEDERLAEAGEDVSQGETSEEAATDEAETPTENDALKSRVQDLLRDIEGGDNIEADTQQAKMCPMSRSKLIQKHPSILKSKLRQHRKFQRPSKRSRKLLMKGCTRPT